MSADNGIYICEDPSGRWHVVHAQAIDNLGYYPEGSQQEAETWQSYFGDKNAKHASSREEIIKLAEALEKDWGWTEYGICDVGKSPVVITE